MTNNNSINDMTRSISPDQIINEVLDQLINYVTQSLKSPSFYVNGCKTTPMVFVVVPNEEGQEGYINWVKDVPLECLEIEDEAARFHAMGMWYMLGTSHGCYAFGYCELVNNDTLLIRVSFFDQRTARAKLRLRGGNAGNLYVAEKEVEYCDSEKHPAQENPLMEFFYGITEGQILAGTKGGSHEV